MGRHTLKNLAATNTIGVSVSKVELRSLVEMHVPFSFLLITSSSLAVAQHGHISPYLPFCIYRLSPE